MTSLQQDKPMTKVSQMPTKTFTLTLTAQQLMVIGQGLGELPHKVAAPVFAALNEQIVAQENPAKVA